MRARDQTRQNTLERKASHKRPHEGGGTNCQPHGIHSANTLMGTCLRACRGLTCVLCADGRVGFRVVIWMTLSLAQSEWGHIWSYGLPLFLPCRRSCSLRTALRVRDWSTAERWRVESWIQTSWWQLWSVGRMPRTSRLISSVP